MKREGLESVDELQSYAIHRIGRFLAKHGRRLIGWDEILDGGLAPDAAVMSWRGEEGGRTAAAAGHEVVMTPGGYCYFDGYQDDPTTEPQAMSGFLPLEKVYSYDPAPADMPGREYVLGVQANLWTEYIPTAEQAEYMLYPRLFALAEVAWCQPEGKDYRTFRERALRFTELARSRGYNAFDLADETGERPESLEPVEHLAVGCPVTYATRWNGGSRRRRAGADRRPARLVELQGALAGIPRLRRRCDGRSGRGEAHQRGLGRLHSVVFGLDLASGPGGDRGLGRRDRVPPHRCRGERLSRDG